MSNPLRHRRLPRGLPHRLRPTAFPPSFAVLGASVLAVVMLVVTPEVVSAAGPPIPDLPWIAPASTGPVPGGIDPLASARAGGVAEVDRALHRLSGHRRLLMIAAHPDDEDTFVLALAARGLGAEAAYLSLSRGDGGQNLVGPETGEGLGLLRTGELQAARRIDGARQFFSRAYDFGYTRSLSETLDRWPEPLLLEDALRVVRRFRPQVLVAVFPNSERAGHGQHRASAHVAERIFELSRDAEAFPELTAEGLDPWPIHAFFRASWWNPDAADLRLPLGGLDPHSGRSIFQVALESRSRHRCQDMGFEQPPGEAETALVRVAPELPEGTPPEVKADLFAGIDTSLAALTDPLADGELRRRTALVLERLENTARTARERLRAADPSGAVEPLAEIVRGLAELRRGLAEAGEAGPGESEPGEVGPGDGRAHVLALLDEKLEIAREGLAAAAGVVVDAITDRQEVVPGQTFQVRALYWDGEYGGGTALPPATPEAPAEPSSTDGASPGSASPGSTSPGPAVTVTIEGPEGWSVVDRGAAEPSSSRFAARADIERAFGVELPADAEPTLPYFLRHSRDGRDVYAWSEVPAGVRGLPEQPAPLWARFRFELAGAPMELWREVVHRRREQALGEVRRPLRVLPALEVSLDRELVVWPLGRRQPLELGVGLRAWDGQGSWDGEGSAEPVRIEVPVRLEVEVPSGWPEVAPMELELGPDGRASGKLRIQVPAELDAGGGEVRVSAVWKGQRWGRTLQEVDYEHIRPSRLPRSAEVRFVAAELDLETVIGAGKIGYVRGAADRMPELLAELGLPVEEIDPAELSGLDLGAYGTLVVGSRAYEVWPELARANGRLLDHARSGGRVIVQYQQYAYASGGLAPFDLDIARPHDRVTDESAPVSLLEPDHPILNRPHRLAEADWQGWVQERGLYFAGSWGEEWTPLLAMADPLSEGPWEGGERGEEKQGALLVGHPGEGVYIYTGLAFFRQLPAGVPGAYRLFLNLLAYDGQD